MCTLPELFGIDDSLGDSLGDNGGSCPSMTAVDLDRTGNDVGMDGIGSSVCSKKVVYTVLVHVIRLVLCDDITIFCSLIGIDDSFLM